MSYLKDVNVKLVSFVRKAANMRTFPLLKSADPVNNIENNNNEEYKPMRKEVKEKLLKTLKVEENLTKESADIVNIMKADTELKLSDAEVAELTDYVDVAKAGFPFTAKPEDKKEESDKKKEEKKEKDEVKGKEMQKSVDESNAVLLKKISDLETTLSNMSKSAERHSIIEFLKNDCSFLPADVEKTADTIISLQGVSKESADSYKETLKKASAAVEQSSILKEVGTSTDEILKSESSVEGFELIKKFTDKLDTIKKSADGNKVSSNEIVNLIKSFGSQYDSYRIAHILRAKREAI